MAMVAAAKALATEGGERGIRTLENLAALRALQARALDHYAISPMNLILSYLEAKGKKNLCLWPELNWHHRLRRPVLYPLSYKGLSRQEPDVLIRASLSGENQALLIH